eukprot:GHRR01034323.1.p1 GENE.GHRR01034323.1~~GHRR01034323.1.p1  ORF type:complete len:369 (+),score=71.72 GHRR01034323.1:1198-2304(+)
MQFLYDVQFAISIFFAANWLFWLWLAEDRLWYICSWMTVVDAITIIPSFVLYIIEGDQSNSLPGLSFLRALRIMRVARIFRLKDTFKEQLQGRVTEAALKLALCLVTVLVVAAGLFYELERYGPDASNQQGLEFHEALYWAAVTVTTVGYGDYSPSWWVTQMILIGVLILTFTLLPYLTGQLMDALTASTVYQRQSYKGFGRRAGVSHAVFLGAIDGPTMRNLLDELYHPDKGFNHQHSIFMCPRAPTLDIQHLLNTHRAASKVMYLQGSPFRQADLHRACAEYASAVFILGPKHAEDPVLADRHTVMVALSLGQYLQVAHVLLQETLTTLPSKLLHYINSGTVSCLFENFNPFWLKVLDVMHLLCAF